MCRPILGASPEKGYTYVFFFRIPVWLLWHRSRPINKAWRPTADVAPRTKDSKDARSGFPFPLFLPQCWAQTNAKVISWLADCCLPPCKKSKSSLAECVAALNSCSQHTKNTADPQPSCRLPFDPPGSPWIAPFSHTRHNLTLEHMPPAGTWRRNFCDEDAQDEDSQQWRRRPKLAFESHTQTHVHGQKMPDFTTKSR